MCRAERVCSALGNSHIDLLGYGKRIVYLDAEIPHGAFDLAMSE
jgi:hypothetical protein